MAKTITPINIATDTFNTWVTQANAVIDALATEVMTANTNANGAFVTGNSQLFGIFTANTVAIYNNLRGGNVQATSTLTISSNVIANTGNVLIGVDGTTAGLLSIFGDATTGGIVHFYNGADDDTNFEYWRVGPDANGNFDITREGINTPFAITRANSLVTVSNGIVVTSGGANITAGGLTVTAGLADFQDSVILSDETATFGIGDTTANLVANNETITLQNSTVSFSITKPTAAQVSNGNIFLSADGVWKEPIPSRNSVVTSGTSAQEVDSFLKNTYRSAEYFWTIKDNSANAHQLSKTIVLHDDSITNAYITQYAIVVSNTNLGTFSANANTTHVIVHFTPTVNATTVRYTRSYIPVA